MSKKKGSVLPHKKVTLDSERAVNEQYQRQIRELLERQPDILRAISVTASASWTGTGPKRVFPKNPLSPIVGRVVLDPDHPDAGLIGENFYIAGWRPGDPDENGVEIVNWAAPFAALFFEGRAAKLDNASSVHGRRTFVSERDDLVDFDDEVEIDVADDPFARSLAELKIPELPLPPTITPTKATPTTELGTAPELELVDDVDELDELIDDTMTSSTLHIADGVELRAKDALLAVMLQPKDGHMGTILPTLQPDQYALIAWPADAPLIVHGQPGTGKTVIAAHRAAFLTSAERGDDRMTRVAIVGPSDYYVDHLHPVLTSLRERDSDIRVMSLPGLLERIVELPNSPEPSASGEIESSWKLGRTIERFVQGLAQRPQGRRMQMKVREVLDRARAADEKSIPDQEYREFFKSLPKWDQVCSQSRYLPMLASFALALDSNVPGGPVAHLVIDEAQDVRRLEWRILLNYVLEHGGSVTLFGDMNQRRSDYVADDWRTLAKELDLTDEDGAVEIRGLGVGYRSTRQIIRFANQLLPRGVRGQKALRDGPAPVLRRVSKRERSAACFKAVVELHDRYRGNVAWITHDVGPADRLFRQAGWSRDRAGRHSWTRDDRTVVVLHPDLARGIEFDAVVVEEPADFPPNVGRDGVLYTSLTRANVELVVVHSDNLPKELRVRS